MAITPAIVDIFLKNLPCKARAEDEEVLRDQVLINGNVLCSDLICRGHQNIQRGLRVNNYLIAALNDRAGYIVFSTFFISIFIILSELDLSKCFLTIS